MSLEEIVHIEHTYIGDLPMTTLVNSEDRVLRQRLGHLGHLEIKEWLISIFPNTSPIEIDSFINSKLRLNYAG